MSKDERISEYERFINTAAADTEVVKLVLSSFIAMIAQSRGAQIIDDLHEITKTAVLQNAPDEGDGQLAKRLHQLTLSQVEEYFRKLRAIVGLSKVGRSGPAN